MSMGYNLTMTIQELSRLEKQKELIGFYKSMWTLVVTLLAAVVAWFAVYDKADVLAGLALSSMLGLSALAIWLHFRVLGLIRTLEHK